MEIEEIIKLLEYVRENEQERYYGRETMIEAIYDKLDDICIELRKINYKNDNLVFNLPELDMTHEDLPF